MKVHRAFNLGLIGTRRVGHYVGLRGKGAALEV
jgi:hypothetical protein